jgi:hypothetical protein
MKSKQIAWAFVIAAGLTGCYSHSPRIFETTTDVEQISTSTYPPHTNRVYLTSVSPPAVKYEVLGLLDVWYGTSDSVLQSLADAARNLGADAVVEVRTWNPPEGWSTWAPHGSGKAVKIKEPSSVDFSSLGGEWK